MSLTSIINGSGFIYEDEFRTILDEAKPLKSDFTTISGRRPFLNICTNYPYILETKYEAQLVGFTFDYLARFMIARKIKKNRMEVTKKLVAYAGLDLLQGHIFEENFDIEGIFNSSINQIIDYIQGNLDDFNILIRSAICLSRLEHVFRSKLFPTTEYVQQWFEEVPKNINQDLTQLCTDFETEFMNVLVNEDSEVIFNPIFGRASEIVHGADADIYIDGTLYDFKTIRHNGYRKVNTMQLIGYYLLERINSEDFNGTLLGSGIKNIAFYKARFGEIEKVDVSNISNIEIHVEKAKSLFNEWDSDLKRDEKGNNIN